MTKTKLVFIAMTLALVAWAGASAASAQEPSIATATADPASVAGAGTYSITLTGIDFMEGTDVGAAACATGDLADITQTSFVSLCPLTASDAATDNGDGTFSVTLEVEVGEDGIVFWMGNPLQRDVAMVAVGIGDMGDDMGDGDDMDGDMGDGDMDDMGDMDDDMGDGDMDDGDMDDGDMGDGDMDDGDMAMEDELADTGSNTPLLVLIALSVVFAGAMVLGLSRRLRTQ